MFRVPLVANERNKKRNYVHLWISISKGCLTQNGGGGGQVSFNQFLKVKLQYPPRVERLQLFAQMQE